jgi:hypothetical protein
MITDELRTIQTGMMALADSFGLDGRGAGVDIGDGRGDGRGESKSSSFTWRKAFSSGCWDMAGKGWCRMNGLSDTVSCSGYSQRQRGRWER